MTTKPQDLAALIAASTFAGALPASLALISLLATVRLYGTGDAMQAATLASALFWLALPSSSRSASVRDETFWLHWQPGSVRRPSRTERANWPTASSR